MSEKKKDNLFTALAKFQQECPAIHKGTKGYGYTYADLSQIFEVINPLLKKHGLGFTQPIQENAIKTIVFHLETGETIESVINIPEGGQLKGMNEFQTMGSAITYLRRYSISSILGLVTDLDNDAGGEQTKPSKKQQRKTLTSERFTKALDALKDGKTTADNIKAYDLTNEQAKQLTEFVNLMELNNTK